MTAQVIKASFNDVSVSFTYDAWFNATTVASNFGKRPVDWLALDSTADYIDGLADISKCEKSSLLKTKAGKNGGTWFHPKLAVAFARWLDVRFAIWCDMQIEKILHGNIEPTQIPKSKKALPGGLTLDQQDSIKEIVRLRVESLPKDKQAKGAITIWSALKSKFDVPTYKAIPPDLVTEAVSVAARVPLDGEMAITASFPEVMKNYRWMVYRDHDQRHHIIPVENDAFVATVSQLIDSIRSPHGMWMTDMELIDIIDAASSRLRARKFPAPN